jgi:hypothetical protein
MMRPAQILRNTENVEQQTNIILVFRTYARIAMCNMCSLGLVSRWVIDRFAKAGKDPRVSSDSIGHLADYSASFLCHCAIELNPQLVASCTPLAFQSINCLTNSKIRLFGLRLFCAYERAGMGPPRDVFQRILEILVSDVEENSVIAAKFLLFLCANRNEEFVTLRDNWQDLVLQRLAAIDGPSPLSDLLIALVLQFPLSSEMIALVVSHFPVISAPLAYSWVYPWVLVQLQDDDNCAQILLTSILALFCQDIDRLVTRGKLSR